VNCSSYLFSGTCEFFLLLPQPRETRVDPENFSHSLVTGGQVSRVDPESTGLNPVWRKSLILAAVGTIWQDGASLTEIQAARRLVVQDMKILEGIAPESGAYLNEVRESYGFRPHSLQSHLFSPQASRYEFDWKKSFFGTHYDKLRAIKRKYDPKSLFLIYEGIGSDEWDADLVCQV